MPGSFMWPSSKSSHVFTCRPAGGRLSRVVASIHLITVHAGLQLGCCRADAGLLLNGCGISPRAVCKLVLSCCQTASRLLLETCCRAGGKLLLELRGFQRYFLASFGPRFWPRFGTRCRNIELRCKSEPHRFVTKTYQNIHESCVHIVFWAKRWHFLDVLVILWTFELDAFCNKKGILPKHTWIMRLHGVLILKHVILEIIFA